MYKFIHRYVRGRWERYYLKSHWHLILDLSLALVILILAATVASLYFYRPNLPLIGQYRPQTVDLNNPPLELAYQVSDPILKADEAAVLNIIFKNNGTSPIEDVVLNFSTLGGDFSVSRLETAAAGAEIRGRVAVIPRIEAGAKGDAAIKVYFNRKAEGRTIEWQAESEYYLSGQLLKSTAGLPAITLAAKLEAKQAIYYTSPQGDQLGIGPVPPIVGIPTNYWLFWEASSENDFKDLVFSGRLPKGVEPAGGRTLLAGDLTYSTSSRQLIWKLPALKGRDDSYRAGIEIRLTPTAEQADRILPLVLNARYAGVDSLTGEKVGGSFKELTTDLETDSFNSGQGRVLAQ